LVELRARRERRLEQLAILDKGSRGHWFSPCAVSDFGPAGWRANDAQKIGGDAQEYALLTGYADRSPDDEHRRPSTTTSVEPGGIGRDPNGAEFRTTASLWRKNCCTVLLALAECASSYRRAGDGQGGITATIAGMPENTDPSSTCARQSTRGV